MYKISYKSIIRTNSNGSLSGIPEDPTNRDYQQFIQDVAEQGYDIVEGPDVVQPSYADLRRPEYPPIEDQLDKIYHSGVNAWKAQIKAIKDKYPKAITGRTDIAPLPDWLYESVNNYIYNQQLKAYVDAVERLEQYRLVDGQEPDLLVRLKLMVFIILWSPKNTFRHFLLMTQESFKIWQKEQKHKQLLMQLLRML